MCGLRRTEREGSAELSLLQAGVSMGLVTRQQIAELQGLDDADEHWFSGVCADITNGESVDRAYANLLAKYDVSWGAVRAWIDADASRQAKWKAALAARKELRIERAAARVAKIASVEHEDSEVTVADTLKAAGMVLEVGKDKGTGVAVQINIGLLNHAASTPAIVEGRVLDQPREPQTV